MTTAILENNVEIIKSEESFEKAYRVMVYNGTAWYTVFQVEADSETEALDRVMDYCVEKDYKGLYFHIWDIWGMGEEDDSFIPCGSSDYYFHQLTRIEEI